LWVFLSVCVTPHRSNKRLAPVQIASYGHSVSTRGSQIDYWIGGAGADFIPADLALGPHPNYAETLVLVPGLGIVHDRPAPELLPRAPRALDLQVP
jgi:hypothetical protein